MVEPTDPEPAPAPEPRPWQRKHRPEPEPPQASDGTSVNGRLLMALLGGIASIGLSIAGFVGALDKRPGEAPAPRPVDQNAQAANPFQQAPGRNSPPADVLHSVETKLIAVGNTVARIEGNTDQNTKDFDNPDRIKLLAELRRVLGELQTQLTDLASTRLNSEERAKRDQDAQRVEELYRKLAALTGD